MKKRVSFSIQLRNLTTTEYDKIMCNLSEFIEDSDFGLYNDSWVVLAPQSLSQFNECQKILKKLFPSVK